MSAIPLFRLVDRVYESLRKGSTTRTLSHMHSFPHFISQLHFLYFIALLARFPAISSPIPYGSALSNTAQNPLQFGYV